MSLTPDYFERLYAASDDPWRISAGWYERRKRAIVLAALPRERFELVFEPACSNGELSVQLAGRCTRLVSWDVVPAAVERTRARTAALGTVEVRSGALPADWPEGTPDLIVLSEVGYYLDAADLDRTVAEGVRRLAAGGVLLAVHWRHPAPDYPLSGDRVHDVIGGHPSLEHLGRYRDEDFTLDLWTAGAAPSVARQTGVV